jgi:hypothetical protein
MEHDVKEGWCICGEFHKVGKVPKRPRKAKKERPPKAKAPDPIQPPASPPEKPKPREIEDLDLKYPFGMPRFH